MSLPTRLLHVSKAPLSHGLIFRRLAASRLPLLSHSLSTSARPAGALTPFMGAMGMPAKCGSLCRSQAKSAGTFMPSWPTPSPVGSTKESSRFPSSLSSPVLSSLRFSTLSTSQVANAASPSSPPNPNTTATSSSPSSSATASSATPPSAANPPTSDNTPQPPPKEGKIKKLMREYGKAGLATLIAVDLASLGAVYLLISSGVDIPTLLDKFNIDHSWLNPNAGTFVVAYAVYKVLAPLRIALAFAITPAIVRKLRALGLVKEAAKHL